MLEIDVPEKLGFLFELHRYKVAYGGRGAAKSHSFAKALLALGAAQRLRILCTREIQDSIKDSVHKLLKDQIDLLGLGSFYDVLDTEIRGANGTEFIFSGLHGHTIESIKSFEGIDIVWVEEAQAVSKTSWSILIPTIRADNSEIWVSFNPDMETDDTYERFVLSRPEGAVVVEMNYYDNRWFPAVLERERLDCQRRYPDDYPNIWLGKPKSTAKGAIYAREVGELRRNNRYRPMPYDPRYPVHTFWDLGWNDKMVVICIQKPHPSFLTIVHYYENNFKRYDEVWETLRTFGFRWGTHYLPHDGESKNPQTGKSAKQVLKALVGPAGGEVRVIKRYDPDEGIRALREVFPRLYINDLDVKDDTGYLGPRRLLECLSRYKRAVNDKTGVVGDPVHDQYSHGCDAARNLAWEADRLRNPEVDAPPPPAMQAFQSTVSGTGTLG